MKNKKRLIIYSIFALILCCLFVTSCKGGKGCKKECDHSWGEWQEVTAPTCMQEGLKERTCSECEEKESEKIEKVGHSFTNYIADGKEAACIEYTKTATCDFDGCNQKDTIVVSITKDHNFVEVEHKDADCENDGYKVVKCDGCGEEHTDVIGLSTGHNVASWTMVSEVKKDGTTCEYIQTYEGYCQNCKQNVQNEESVFKHTLDVRVTLEATCVDAGTKEQYCTENGCNYTKEEEYTAPHAHSYDDGVLDGVVTTYTCVNGCGHFKTTIVAKEEVAAEVSKENLNGNSVELKNAEIALDSKTLDGLENSDVTLGADVLDNDTKESLMGSLTEEQKAQIGDSTIYNFTMKQGDDVVAEFNGFVTITIPYTLTPGENPENIAIWYVTDDGTIQTIEATYANGFVTFKTNHFSYYTVTRLTPKERCAIYGHIHVEITVDPTCTKDGYILNICQRCGESVKEVIKAEGHDYKTETVDATCAKEGSITHTCDTCKFSYVEVLPKLSHKYNEVERVEATTETEGYIKYECSECGATKEDVLPKIDENIADLTVVDVLKKTLTNFDFNNIVLKITNLEASVVENRHIIDSSYVYSSDKVSFEIAEMYLGLDSNNNLIGSGNVTVKLNHGKVEEKMSVKAYLYNGVFYGIASSEVNGVSVVNANYIKVDLAGLALSSTKMFGSQDENTNEIGFDSLLEALNGTTGKNFESFEDVEKYLNDLISWCEENVVPFIENLDVKEIEKFGKDLVEKLLKLNVTTDGYQINVNTNALNELYDYLTENYIYDILADIFGEKVLKNIELVLNFNVGKLIKFVESRGFVLSEAVEIIDGLLQYVLETEDITLNAILGGMMDVPEFDIVEFVNSPEVSEISVKQLIENYFGLEIEEFKTQVNEMLEAFKETKIVDLIPTSEAPAMITLLDDYILLASSALTIDLNINKYFNLEKINFNFSLEQNEENTDLLPEGFIANCSLELLFNTSSYQVLTSVKSEVDQLYNDIILNFDIETLIESRYYNDYGYDIEYVYDGDVLEKVVIKSIVEKPTYPNTNLENTTVYQTIYEIYAQDIYDALQITFYEKCNNWYSLDFEIAVKEIEVVKEIIYAEDKSGQVSLEENILEERVITKVQDFEIFYNTVTKETKNYSDNGIWNEVDHKWVVTSQTVADKCGNYTITHKVCSVCKCEEVDYQRKYHSFYFDSLDLNGSSCEDGYDYVIKCHDCDLVLEGYGDAHYQIETYYDLTDFGATCEGEIVIESCACGEYSNFRINGTCDFEWKYDAYEYSDYETLFGDKDVSYYETHVCAVTDPKCGFRYTTIHYYEQDPTYPCVVVRYTAVYLGHSATKLGDAKEIIIMANDKDVRHEWNYTEVGNEEIRTCIHCSAKIISQHQQFNHNGKTFTKIVFERYENTDPFKSSWYQSAYTYYFDSTCVCVETYTDSDGECRDYQYNCCQIEWISTEGSTCTQDGIIYSKCFICGNEGEYRILEPHGHDFIWNHELEMYECYKCGIKNTNGANGSITLEDASDMDSDADTLIVGYYNPKDIEYVLNVTLILKNPANPDEDEILVLGVDFEELPYGRYVSISKSQVEKLAKELGYEPSEYNIRLSFVPVNFYDDLDYAITFE